MLTTLVLLFCFGSALAQNEAKKQTISPADLIKESYTLNPKIHDVQARTSHLTDLAYLSVDLAPDQLLTYCKELQKVAKDMPLIWDRVASQKNALVPCSDIDSKWAFESLRQIDPITAMHGVEDPSEDPRTDAANRFLLPRYFKHFPNLESFQQVSDMADFLAEKSQYPYEGVGDVLKQAGSLPGHPISNSEQYALFMRSLNNYRDLNRPQLGNDGHTFYMFLKYTGGLVVKENFFQRLFSSRVNRNLYQSAIQSLVERTLSSPVSPKEHWYGELVGKDGKVIYSFHDRNTIYLYREWDVIQANPKTAAGLIKSNSVFAMKGEVKNTLVSFSDSQQQSDKVRDLWNQRILVVQMKTLSDPKKGEEIIAKLVDPATRASGLCYQVRVLAKSDPQKKDSAVWQKIEEVKARCLEEYEHLSENTVQERVDRLNALVIILESSWYTNPEGFADRFTKTFKIAVQKYEEQYLEEPGWRVARYSLYPVVQRMIKFSVDQGETDLVVAQVRAIPHNTLLKSGLLLEIAREIGDLQKKKN